MLELALAATGAQLERICSGFRRATEPEIEAGQDRYVRGRALGNGLVKLETVLSHPPPHGNRHDGRLRCLRRGPRRERRVTTARIEKPAVESGRGTVPVGADHVDATRSKT